MIVPPIVIIAPNKTFLPPKKNCNVPPNDFRGTKMPQKGAS